LRSDRVFLGPALSGSVTEGVVPSFARRLRDGRLLVASAWIACGVAVAVTVRADDPPEYTPGKLEIARLDNGLNVVIQEDHRVPLVALTLYYGDGGSRSDPEGKSGLAELTADLMARRTEHLPEDAYAKLLGRIGAGWRYATRIDDAVFEVQVPSNQLALPLWAWSDQMGFFEPGLSETLVGSQREVIETRRKNADGLEPLRHLARFAEEEMYPPGHPYRRIVGELEELQGITRDDVFAFHKANFGPDHATLTIVGDVDSAKAFAMVRRYFETIPSSGAAARPATAPAAQLPGQILVDVAARVETARVVVRWPSPPYLSTDDATLDLVSKLFSGRRTGWLYWHLVDTQKIAKRVWANQMSRELGSEFEVTVEGAPGHPAKELLAALDASLASLAGRRADDAELRGAFFETVAEDVFKLDDVKVRAWRFGRYFEAVGTPDYYEHDIERYERGMPQVAGAIAKWMPRDRRVVLLVQPDPKAAPGGERVGRTVVPQGQP
jgi:zinc protease